MARISTGVDVGARTKVLLAGHWKGNTLHVTDYSVTDRATPSGDVAAAWQAVECDFKVVDARIALTGRDVNVRYTRVPRVPDWQLRKLMRFEVEEIGGQSGTAVASDFNLLPALPEIEDEDVVLLAMARETLLEQHLEGLAAIGGRVEAFAPAALGLYNAWIRFGVIEDENVLIASMGHDNLDVILVRGPDLLFARNLSGGSRLFDEAIAERFGVPLERAESLKRELATLRPGASHATANHEKASRALLAPAGQILSLLQSTVLFCRSQVKVSNLRIDRVYLAGGGSALDGLPEYLAAGLSVPVQLFEPFRVVDVSALDEEAAARLEEYRLESVVALGLATMGSDPEAYSVEILPQALRRRREFVGGTLFAIAAAVLAVCFLVFEGWKTSTELAATSGQVDALESQLRRAQSTDRKTRELLERNAELEEDASLLLGVAGSGEQLARALEHLGRHLPEGFWIETLSSEWRHDEQLGIARGEERPILALECRAREGTESIASLLDRFVATLREELPEARFHYAPSASGEEFTLQLTMFGPEAEQPADDEDADDGERLGG
jgi:Tfp pilus assembly PilM family ATPase